MQTIDSYILKSKYQSSDTYKVWYSVVSIIGMYGISDPRYILDIL